MKIFIGFVNIASKYMDYYRGLTSMGHEVFTVDFGAPSPIINSSEGVSFSLSQYTPLQILSTKNPERQKQINGLHRYYYDRIYELAISEYEVFIFMWQSFKPGGGDLQELKNKGKKIIIDCVGTDVRFPDAAKQWGDYYNLPPRPFFKAPDRNEVVHYLRNAEKYADLILGAGDDSMALALRPFMKVPRFMDYENIKYNTEQRPRPLVVHAPSDKGHKGSKYIIEAVEKLKNEGEEFDFELIENLSHGKALDKYREADLVIEGLTGIGGGKLHMEGLASGTIVMAFFPPDIPYTCMSPVEEIPVINTNYTNIYEKLKMVINNYEMRKEVAGRTRAYVEKYFDPQKSCKMILDGMEGNIPEHMLVNPFFFRDYYQPKYDYLSMFNKNNQFVSGCEWYKEYVKPGKRSGLIF